MSAPITQTSLKVALVTSASYSNKDADEENDGLNQVDTTIVAAVTDADGKVVEAKTDCTQGKITFNAKGEATYDAKAVVKTKLELGDDYNMAKFGQPNVEGGTVKEWYVQTKAFEEYVIGKTAAEVSGIAIDEATHPTDADLASSVTIAIGGFQALIAKAAQ